jgi:hypothetical protein
MTDSSINLPSSSIIARLVQRAKSKSVFELINIIISRATQKGLAIVLLVWGQIIGLILYLKF